MTLIPPKSICAVGGTCTVIPYVCSPPLPSFPYLTCSFSVSPCGTGANRYATINDALNYYNLSSFRSSLYCAGLSGSISLGQPAGITVFAPTNAAFASLLTKQNMTMKVRPLCLASRHKPTQPPMPRTCVRRPADHPHGAMHDGKIQRSLGPMQPRACAVISTPVTSLKL